MDFEFDLQNRCTNRFMGVGSATIRINVFAYSNVHDGWISVYSKHNAWNRLIGGTKVPPYPLLLDWVF